ncbi:ribonuclease P protein component [Acidihalobacter yilgarnensis]|uniref:Ribonuclease P protein component n=1 Tax=Acidihalobacter yilgarnensis TaxID=2819280 RepID=A0A1D8ITN9_9GAMM|nr:ribonuclease P protein component [Acidihalobacter yilgarnensis]AOU99851.1 ribonuclease P protein component [Acidihalobacter yilgarnensis]
MPAQSFPRCARLTEAADYGRVFAGRKKSGGRVFLLKWVPNGLGKARLGLAISRKCARSAVVRQRIKRVIRESFRLRQTDFPAVDVVVMCRPDAAKLDKQQLREALERQWQSIG